MPRSNGCDGRVKSRRTLLPLIAARSAGAGGASPPERGNAVQDHSRFSRSTSTWNDGVNRRSDLRYRAPDAGSSARQYLPARIVTTKCCRADHRRARAIRHAPAWVCCRLGAGSVQIGQISVNDFFAPFTARSCMNPAQVERRSGQENARWARSLPAFGLFAFKLCHIGLKSPLDTKTRPAARSR